MILATLETDQNGAVTIGCSMHLQILGQNGFRRQQWHIHAERRMCRCHPIHGGRNTPFESESESTADPDERWKFD